MPTTFILTTESMNLRDSWARQLPTPAAIPQSADELGMELQRPGARVWIRDLRSGDAGCSVHPDTVVIVVGEPKSIPFEEARQHGQHLMCLSYEESATVLLQVSGMAAELAEKRALITTLTARSQRSSRPSQAPFPETAARTANDMEFVEAALDHLDDLPGIVDVFKRGLRSRLRAAKVAIFLRSEGEYLAATESWRCGADDPMVLWLQQHAAIVDAEALSAVDNPLIEAQVLQKMASWNARLIAPIEIRGALAGWVCFGPRGDARPYSQGDREDALMVVSLLTRVIAQHKVLRAAQSAAADGAVLNQHGPKYRLIRGNDAGKETLPVEVREIIGQAKREKCRVEREFGSLRVSAGPIMDSDNFWVLWDDVSSSAALLAKKLEDERFRILRDVGLILAHELSNALFAVTSYFQHVRMGEHDAGALVQLEKVAASELVRLKEMPHILDSVFEMTKEPPTLVNMRKLVETLAKTVDGVAELVAPECELWGHEDKIFNALLWLCREIKEKRTEPVDSPQVRIAAVAQQREGNGTNGTNGLAGAGAAVANTGRTGEASKSADKIRITLHQRQQVWRTDVNESVNLVSIAYPGLRLDQIKIGDPSDVSEYPTTSVYLAREIIRFHYGTVQIGQGMDGAELHVTLKSRDAAANKFKPSEQSAGHA